MRTACFVIRLLFVCYSGSDGMEYTTVGQSAKAEFVEKRSRFIGYAMPVDTEEQAAEFIASKRSEHWDATHNVYAYSIREGMLCRYSDDGEPSGTAGMPVLSVLTKGNITDAVIVVTRYFGGVLLGTGGLVRAYSHAAQIAVEAAGIVMMKSFDVMRLECGYTDYGRVSAVIPENGGIITGTDFTDKVELSFRVVPELARNLAKKLADATAGRVTMSKTGEVIAPSEAVYTR